MNKFIVTEKGSHHVAIDVRHEKTNTKLFTFSCKWDGCINFWAYSNGVEEIDNDNTDYMHLCDLDEMIQILLTVKEVRLKELSEFKHEWE